MAQIIDADGHIVEPRAFWQGIDTRKQEAIPWQT